MVLFRVDPLGRYLWFTPATLSSLEIEATVSEAEKISVS